MSATGPCGGKVKRQQRRAPKKSPGSNASAAGCSIGREYCSSICCMQATKQAIIAREHDPGVAATIFSWTCGPRARGLGRSERARDVHGVRYIRSMVSGLTQDPRTANLEIPYKDEGESDPSRSSTW